MRNKKNSVLCKENSTAEAQTANPTVQHAGFDLNHTDALRLRNDAKCQRTVQRQQAKGALFNMFNVQQDFEELVSNFESKIRKKTIQVIRNCKRQMQYPARAQHEHVSLTESMLSADCAKGMSKQHDHNW